MKYAIKRNNKVYILKPRKKKSITCNEFMDWMKDVNNNFLGGK